ncbi:MAG: ATP-dependent Clp protease adaptor ClpS [Anaerolineae bacterium]
MSDTTTAPPIPAVDLEFVVMDEAELEKPYRVIIHNDDVTPMDFVVAVLVTIFELNARKAAAIMLKAHNSGQALVAVLPYQEAHRRVYNAQTAAREFGYPLSFTLEPD